MSYDFLPMTEEEINAAGLVEDGIYDFEVIKSERQVSRNGNPMAKLNIKFWDKQGNIHTLFDYLVFSNVPFCLRKVKHFCEATGMSDDYKKGQIQETLDCLEGKMKVVKKVGVLIPEDKLNGKPLGSFYPDKNEVEDYIPYDVKSSALQPLKDTNVLTMDDIPF